MNFKTLREAENLAKKKIRKGTFNWLNSGGIVPLNLLLKRIKSSKFLNFNISLAHKHRGRPAKNIKASLKREITHRDSCILGFYNLASPADIILLSDLDEIPSPKAIKETIKNKIKDRDKARKKGDYKLADNIRKELDSNGVVIEDKGDETIWKYK